LKSHLARNQVNVEAETIEKAIVLPEEQERDDNARHYPKLTEMLFHNPFAKAKKKKKKGKKKSKK
jgi:hypothetical protein